jgi:uncharacterized membrane protein YraQ (UPF0718 family)
MIMAKKVDKTDPICGMKGHIYFEGHYFCSEGCIKKYKEGLKPKWWQDPLQLAPVLIVAIIAVSYFIPFLQPLFTAFMEYVYLIWWAVPLGLLIGGLIDYYIPEEYFSKHLSQKKPATIFYAVTLGFFMAACSHGILAIAIELYKKGASVAAVVAFLLASPWANIPITILLFGFFGFKALYFVASALIVAVITGFIFQFLDSKNLIEKNKHTVKIKKGFSVRKDIVQRLKDYKPTFENIKKDINGILYGASCLNRMVIGWIMIGIFMASLARAFIPHTIFNQYFGPTVFGLLVTLIAATIIEVCSEGSAPIAFEIFNQSGAFGNSFVFLMAGVVTDYTEIGLLWSNIGKKTAIWLPLVTVPQVILIGYLFNIFL